MEPAAAPTVLGRRRGRQRSAQLAVTATTPAVRVHAPAEAVAERINPAVGVVEAVDEHTCVLVNGADSLAVHLGMLGADFEVTDPPELVEHIRRIGDRYARPVTAETSRRVARRCGVRPAWDSVRVTTTEPAPTRALRPPQGYHLAGSVGILAMGAHDPCARFVDGAFWWATRTPDGPATLSLRRAGGDVLATGYGPGAAWVLKRADAVAGLRDDVSGFADVAAAHPVIARLALEHRGLRLPATGQIFPRLLRAIFEQKVTGKEAFRAYSATVRHFGSPAPGPLQRLWAPPEPAVVAAAPYWVFHPFGVEQRRADTLRRAAAVADRLERCADAAEATRRLTAIAGIGPWTAAEVVRIAYGDADAVSVGDYHIPNIVAWALAGEARADDARMLALLEPFRGHRGRVCVLLAAAGRHAPRFGPRMPIRSFARF